MDLGFAAGLEAARRGWTDAQMISGSEIIHEAPNGAPLSSFVLQARCA
jgi:hypothetical protein